MHPEIPVHHATRQAATYWLLRHLEGIENVQVPETAFFDGEGVLEAWIYTTPTKNQRSARCRVARRDFVQTNLLRFEAQLQDLAREKKSILVAVQWMDEQVLLNEANLDILVRSLCAREMAMTASEPNLSIPRHFLEGNFCLQEAICPPEGQYLVTQYHHEVIKVPDNYIAGKFPRNQSHSRCGRFLHSARSQDLSRVPQNDYCDDEETRRLGASIVDERMSSRLEEIVYLVLQHIKHASGMTVEFMTVEFVHQPRTDIVYLVGAQSIITKPVDFNNVDLPHKAQPNEVKTKDTTVAKVKNHDSKTTRVRTEDSIASLIDSLHPTKNHHKYRICRLCRSASDMDFAHELMRHQAVLRSVLSKYQSAQEAKLTAEQYFSNAQTEIQRQHQEITGLNNHMQQLCNALHEKNHVIEELRSANVELQHQLTESNEQIRALKKQVHQAQAREETTQLHRQTLQQEWRLQSQQHVEYYQNENIKLQQQLTSLEQEMQRLAKSQKKYEQVCAERDELRFQWRLVCRKLTDVNEQGVAPPRRIAGGYSSYPNPSAENVREVVKWIVDYEAKKTVVDAQKKTVGTRVKLKFKLTKALASPTIRKSKSQSPSRSFSSLTHTNSLIDEELINNTTVKTSASTTQMTLLTERLFRPRASCHDACKADMR